MFSPYNSKEMTPNELYAYLTKVIGREFHEYREKKGLSLRDIYIPEKISMAVISDLENGKKMPRVETLIRLMNIVDMPYSCLFNAKKLPKTMQTASTRIALVQGSNYLNDDLAELLLQKGYNHKEIEMIAQFMNFVKFQRSKITSKDLTNL